MLVTLVACCIIEFLICLLHFLTVAMALPVTVRKLKEGLYRILWNMDNKKNSPSFNYSSEAELTSFGVNERYKLESSMNNCNTADSKNPLLLKITLLITTSDEISTNNFKQRKVIARFLGYEKEMRFTLNFTSDSKSDIDKKQVALNDRNGQVVKKGN